MSLAISEAVSRVSTDDAVAIWASPITTSPPVSTEMQRQIVWFSAKSLCLLIAVGSKSLFVRFRSMHLLLLSLLLVVSTLNVVLAAPYRMDPRHHLEGRPNPAQVVPSGWRFRREEGRYVSADGSSWFAASASPVASEPIAAHMDRIARQDGENVTYFRREADWIAVSGFRGSRIFYRKAVVACGGKVWHYIEFEYPAARKRQMDPFVNRASYTIDHAENSDCRKRR